MLGLAPIVKFPQTRNQIALTRIRKYMDQGTYSLGRYLLTADKEIYEVVGHSHGSDSTIKLEVRNLDDSTEITEWVDLMEPSNVCLHNDLDHLRTFTSWADLDDWNICSVCNHVLVKNSELEDVYDCLCCKTRYRSN